MEQDTKMEADSTLPEDEKEVGTSDVLEDDENDVVLEDDENDAVLEDVENDAVLEDVENDVQDDDENDVQEDEENDVQEDDENDVQEDDENNVEDVEPSAEHEDNRKKDIKIKEGFPAKQVDDRIDAETSVVQEPINTYDAGNSAENCSKSELCTKKKFKGLKVKRKIVKKSPACSLLKSNKAQGSLTVKARRREKKNKSALQVNGVSNEMKVEDAGQLNGKEDIESSVSKEEQTVKSEETDDGQERTSELENSSQHRKNEEKGGSSDKSKKNKKNDHLEKVQRKKYKNRLGGLIFMCNEKTRSDCFYYRVMGVSAGKKDVVLAIKPGLKLFLYDVDLKLLYGIYRASSSGGMKLEPKAFHGAFPAQVRFKVFKDCVPLPERTFKQAIKDNYYQKHKFKTELSVMQVEKLSRLFRPVELHSSGATLQSPPRAPIGNRNNVRRKDREVRSRDPNSKSHAGNHHQLSHKRDHKVARRAEASRHREEASRDIYPSKKEYQTYGGASRHREEASRDIYPSKKEYQTYGVPTERRNLDPVPRPTLETYHRAYDRDYHHRRPELKYRDVVSEGRVRVDPVYLVGEDYPTYRIDPRPEQSPPRTTRYAYDRNHSREYGVPLVDPYLLPLRREGDRLTYSARNYIVDTEPTRDADALSYYNQRRHEKLDTDVMPVTSVRNYVVDIEPTRHATDALSSCNQRRHEKLDTDVMPISSIRNYVVETEPTRHAIDALSYYHPRRHEKLEDDVRPVTSRYSFVGPSYSYR